jgi:hypothetical protein
VLALFTRMDCAPDIFFVEAICNGLLLAGLLALLALGLNLIFGVIEVVWICYAEIVMIGMYGIDFAFKGACRFRSRPPSAFSSPPPPEHCCIFSSLGRCSRARPSISCW